MRVDPNRLATTRVLDSLPDAVVALDLEELTVVHLNPPAETLFGFRTVEVAGRSALELLHPDDVPLALAGIDWVGDHDRGSLIELRVQGAQGEKLVELAGGRHEAPDGDLLLLLMRDLTDRRRWEIAHDDASAFRALVHHSGSLLAHLDADGTVLAASAALTRDLGHDQAHVVSTSFHELVHVEDRLTVSEALAKVAAGATDGRVTVEARLTTSGARATQYQLEIATLDGDPTVDGLVVSAHDISALDEARQELAHAASHDTLTGLLNRAGFMERLEADMRASRHRLTVAFVDLNGFKPVNDRFGHAMGDRLLHIVAGRLAAAIRQHDYAARLGGDEFAIALHAVDASFVDRIVERLENAIAEPVVLAQDTVSITASIGTASCSQHPSADAVLAVADAAMYRRKSTG
ncbi:MAG: diguanylate cyclase [Actinomycetota bacterium]